MKVYKISKMKGGWFMGNFKPTAFKTKHVEAAYKHHRRGEKWDVHFQKKATEINFLAYGRMRICGKEVKSGDVFVIEPKEVTAPEFLTDCYVFCIKVPSLPDDKVVINPDDCKSNKRKKNVTGRTSKKRTEKRPVQRRRKRLS